MAGRSGTAQSKTSLMRKTACSRMTKVHTGLSMTHWMAKALEVLANRMVARLVTTAMLPIRTSHLYHVPGEDGCVCVWDVSPGCGPLAGRGRMHHNVTNVLGASWVGAAAVVQELVSIDAHLNPVGDKGKHGGQREGNHKERHVAKLDDCGDEGGGRGMLE